jgi:hypothetical protein
MVNQFENKFMYNKAIKDGVGLDDFVHSNLSGDYKIAVIGSSPNTTYTICHSGIKSSAVVVGSSQTQSSDISAIKLDNVISYNVDSGKCVTYTTPDTSNYLVIQVVASSDTTVNIAKIMVLKGDYSVGYNIPFSSFSTDSWLVGDKFMSYIMGAAINPKSSPEDINYIQNIIKYLDPSYESSLVPGVYDDTLKGIIKELQIENNISFSLGYVDPVTESYLLSKVEGSGIDLYE